MNEALDRQAQLGRDIEANFIPRLAEIAADMQDMDVTLRRYRSVAAIVKSESRDLRPG
ncbi:hypothetical protein [Acidiphilium acidophilum]|uniref:hypothetical protein n=1 Tax=Acidiphilium acidophilum TaxID=76588 RepID=UPI002E8E64F7|nr:hypothetical protein [Acidiphilium acidophilum]